MRSQTWQFLRSLVRDAIRGTADFIAITIGSALAAALIMGTLYLLGWGLAALDADHPTTQAERTQTAMLLLIVLGAAWLAHLIGRDIWRALIKRWHAAGRKVRGWGDHPHA